MLRRVDLRDPDRYEIRGEHGRGGIGRVSRAYDRELGRDVAIKELIARSEVGEARFVREALITAGLEHPGIVPVHEAGRWHDGTPFYAMKLVAGRPLRDLIAERATVDERIALLHHVIAVADAIAYAHGRHIIHRDLKPANVIVGEFGETVVIDWGLAKDLSAGEPETVDRASSPPEPVVRDLTVTGSVLGTPAYMAPEQERGEHVDQRVDVFAIGAMLWELCAVQKVPPVSLRQRHAMLRRNGIDRDLSTILDKALAPDPAYRYRDAGELAADLKAFKAGARIAARSYSLPAVLVHWTRRHRALALSIATVLALAATGGALYVRGIATSQRSATAALDALTLRHAQQLLATDPAAALDELASYRGADAMRAKQITAEARGRGAPILRATPHQGNVLWIKPVPGPAGEPLGGVISGSDDHTIMYTARDGSSHVIARDVMGDALALAYGNGNAYSAARQILAYACDPGDVCLLDVAHHALLPRPPALRGLHPWMVGFSPSGDMLAVESHTGLLTVFDVHALDRPILQMTHPIAHRGEVQFLDDNTVGFPEDDAFVILNVARGAEAHVALRFSLPEAYMWSVDPVGHHVTVSSNSGDALLIEGPAWHVAARASLCHDWVSGIQWISRRHEIAYLCQEGVVGFWDPVKGTVTPRAHLEGSAYRLRISPDDDYLVMASGVAEVYVLDLLTDLLTRYKGFDIRPTVLSPPTAEVPFMSVGNGRGEIRVWPMPPRIAKTIFNTRTMLTSAAFVPGSTTLVATPWKDELVAFSPSTGARTLEPHDLSYKFLVVSPDAKVLIAFGRFDEVEQWSVTPMMRTRLLPTGHGSVSQLRFLPDSTGFVTSGHDGRLVRWTLAGDAAPTPSVIAKIDQPIENFVIAPASHAIVWQARDGGLWQTSLSSSVASPPTRLVDDHASSCVGASRMRALPDGFTVYCGTQTGDVRAIDTRDHQVSSVVQLPARVQEIAITPDAKTIAISTETNVLYVGTRPTPSAAWAWRPIELRTTRHAITSDGVIVASGNDGTLWLYDVARDHWLCLPVGSLDIHRVVIDSAGDAAAVLTVDGRLLWLDLVAARKLLAAAS